MSNTFFKKAIASAAALSIVLSVVSPVVGVKAADANVDAANRLAELGVIVDQSENPTAYRLGDKITRGEMAKVMLNLAGEEPQTYCEGKFSDVTALKPNNWVCGFVEKGLALGFLSANNKFRPNDDVSEAEALKMIMEALGVSPKADVSDWAESYRQAGIEAGILAEGTKVTHQVALRSFVFTTADAGVSSTSGEGADEDGDINLDDLFGDLFGDGNGDVTSTGTTSTGTTSTGGTDTSVKAGDLEVSLNPSSLANGTQVPSNGSIRFAKVDFTAGSSDVSLNTSELKSLGLASVPTTTRVWFEKNGKRLTGKAAFSADRTAVVSFAPAFVVKAGSTETLDLYVDLSASPGSDFQFSGKVTDSSALNVQGEFVSNTLRAAAYTVASVAFKKEGNNTSVTQTSEELELGRFSLTNSYTGSETRDVNFETITLRNNGNGDLVDLTDLVLERNGKVVSTEASISGKDVTFVVNDTIKSGGTQATYYVKAKVATVQNNNGDTYQFGLRNDTDLNAIEVLNGFRSSVTGKDTLYTYTVNGADITFARDSSVELSKTYAKGSSDVVFMQGTISSKTPITLEDPTLTFNSTGSDLFTTLYLQIGSSVMTWSATATGTAQFSGLATVNGTANVKLYARLKDTATSVNVKFDDLRLTSFGTVEYVSNQNVVKSAVGSISGVQVTVGTTNLSVTRVDGLGDTKVAVGSKGVVANELSLSVTQGNDVQISNATYTVTASGSFSNNVFATLYIDGAAVSTKTVSGTTLTSGTVTFNNVNKVISKGTSVKLAVKLDLSDAYNDGDFSIQLSNLDAVDTLTSATVGVTVPGSAKLTVSTAKGTLTSSDANPRSQMLLAGSKDQKLMAFRVKATNDSVKLRDVNFTGTGLENLSNFRILTPTGKYLSATSNVSTGVMFTNIADTDNYTVAMDKTETFYLVADVNTNVSGVNDLAVTLNASTSNVKASNGTLSQLQGGNFSSNVHAIEENVALIAKASNPSKLLITSALRFTVTASGKDQVTLSGAELTLDMYGISGTGVVKIYKDNTSNLVGTYDNSGAGVGTGSNVFTVNLNSNNTVDNGNTSTYFVAVEGVTEGGVANVTPTWSIKLNNVKVGSTGSINANVYENMGTFPITETK